MIGRPYTDTNLKNKTIIYTITELLLFEHKKR